MRKPKIEVRIVEYHPIFFLLYHMTIDRVVCIPEKPERIWLPSFSVSEWSLTPEAIIKQALRTSRYSVKWCELCIWHGSKLMLHAVRGTPDENTARLVAAELER